jgi:hypothetical protein
MFPRLQVIAVWMTAATLLTQAVHPGLIFGCGCQAFGSCGFADQEACCCCSDDKQLENTRSDTEVCCHHCKPPADSDKPHDGFQLNSVCHCGDFAPVVLVEPMVPRSSELTLQYWLDLIVGNTPCPTLEVSPTPTLALPSILLSGGVSHNCRQALLSVWLT